jgi:hypothetical protein
LYWLLLEAADCKLKGAGKKKELKGDLTRKQKYQGNKSALLENNPSREYGRCRSKQNTIANQSSPSSITYS